GSKGAARAALERARRHAHRRGGARHGTRPQLQRVPRRGRALRRRDPLRLLRGCRRAYRASAREAPATSQVRRRADADAGPARRLVRDWDGALSVDSAAAAIYESWLVHMCERTFRDKLGQSLYEQYLTDGRPTFALYDLIGCPSSTWFADLASGEAGDRDAIAGAALEDAVRDLVKRLGPTTASWRWGDLHTVS